MGRQQGTVPIMAADKVQPDVSGREQLLESAVILWDVRICGKLTYLDFCLLFGTRLLRRRSDTKSGPAALFARNLGDR